MGYRFDLAFLMASWLALAGLGGCSGNTSPEDAAAEDTAGDGQDSDPIPPDSVLPPDRMVDWTHAGVIQPDGTRGIPDRTTICATIDADTYGDGATDATAAIQEAIDGCPQDQVVVLPPGTYLITGLSISSPVVLRGAGADQTTIVEDGSIVFNPFGGLTSAPIGTHAVDWTAGYEKDATAIELADTTGLSAGQMIVLDQLNDTSLVNVVGNEGHCGPGGAGNNCGRADDISEATCHGWCAADERAMPQIVRITAISGNQVAIDSPLHFTHRADLSPQAFFWDGPRLEYAGIEDLRVDAQFIDRGVGFSFTANCWVKGIEIDNISRGAVWMFWTYHNEVRDSYFFHTEAVAPQNYGIEMDDTTASLLENNIMDETTAGFMVGWPNTGAVVAYNYTIHDGPGSPITNANVSTHDAHNYMNLFEGNITPKMYFDFIWGSSSHETVFRNYLSGFKDPALNEYWSNFDAPLVLEAWNRYFNFVGNVLGKAGMHDVYESSGPDTTVVTKYFDASLNETGWTDACSGGLNADCQGIGVGPIYTLGFYNTYSPDSGDFDDQVAATILRWGNFDYATGQVRWLASEVPGGATLTQYFPASLYLGEKPAWWGSASWPAIGPDVTGGDADTSGHASRIPAQICYESTVGAGGRFNAATCYGD